tara:strand:+ start:2617 stop:3243 length:627 start_codon:yes stop_codon:yes gene_type:complete
MKLKVLNIEGKETGREISLNDKIFKIEPNSHVVYLAVKQYMANNRQGTHKAKARSEIIGSTRKIKKQKGTGTARAGSIKSPLFRGGGRTFGPLPRNYSLKLNKKVKKLAKKSVFSSKLASKSVLILDDFSFEKPNSKKCVKMLSDLGISSKKSLLISEDKNDNLLISSRNVKKVSVLNSNEINIFELMNASKIVISEAAMKKIESLLK